MAFYSSNGFTLINSLLGEVNLTTNPDSGKYYCFGYVILFDIPLTLSLPNGGFGRSIKIFCADVTSSMFFGNKRKTS